jgi:hypothetical protein
MKPSKQEKLKIQIANLEQQRKALCDELKTVDNLLKIKRHFHQKLLRQSFAEKFLNEKPLIGIIFEFD